MTTQGFDTYYGRLRAKGHKWSRKWVLRVYRKMNLAQRCKCIHRLPARVKQSIGQPITINRTWSLDFMHDSLEYGRKIQVLNIMGDFSREALVVKPAFSHRGESVVAALEEII